MKKFLFLISSGLFLAACNDQPKTAVASAGSTKKNTDLLSQNLKGRVERIEESTYAADSSGKMGKQDSTISISEFNEQGYQVKVTTKDLSGQVKEEQAMSHHPNGATREFSRMKNGKTIERWVIDLDSNGKYKKATIYDSTGKMSSYWTNITENEFGQVLSGTQYTTDNRLMSSFTNQYNGPLFIGGSSKDSTGRENYRNANKMDEKGYPMELSTTTINNDSTITETISFKYDSWDEKGNWTQRTEYNDKGKATKINKRTFSYYKD